MATRRWLVRGVTRDERSGSSGSMHQSMGKRSDAPSIMSAGGQITLGSIKDDESVDVSLSPSGDAEVGSEGRRHGFIS